MLNLAHGITRINITDKTTGRGSWRFDKSRNMQDAADIIYPLAFASAGMPLASGRGRIDTTLAEFEAGYDKSLGIDVFIKFANGQTATMQEKFLFTTFYTVTVEYMQDHAKGLQGDWFGMKCQYYFCGYADDKTRQFTRWILLDWPTVTRATMQRRITWLERQNLNDGARASFKYARFDGIPKDCIIAVSHPP